MKRKYNYSIKVSLNLKKNTSKIIAINGQDHKIVPGVILVEGVHFGNGTGTPLFYSAKVLEESTKRWDNILVTNSHPKDSKGNLVSLNEVNKDEWVIGFLMEPTFQNNSIKVKVALNKKQVETINPKIWDEVEDLKMEVSTGLSAYVEEKEGIWNGEKYGLEALELFPDHLALLPDEIGACSHQDGCGIRNIHNSNENPDERYKRLFELSNKLKEMSFGEIRDQISLVVYGYDEPLNQMNNNSYKFHYINDVYPDYFIFSEESKDGIRYFKQKYSVNKDNQVEIEEEKIEVKKKISWIPIIKGENQMAKTDETVKKCCAEKVLELIQNKKSPYTEEDSSWLEALTQEQFNKIAEPFNKKEEQKEEETKIVKTENTIASPADNDLAGWLQKSGAPPRLQSFIFSAVKELDESRKEMITSILANEKNVFTEEQLMAMDQETLKGFAKMAAKPQEVRSHHFGGRIFEETVKIDNQIPQVEAYVPETLGSIFKK